MLNCLIATEQLKEGGLYDLDFDHQFIEAEKFDSKPTFKKFLGYKPGVAVIGDTIVGIENSNDNTNVRFHQKDMLKRFFERLRAALRLLCSSSYRCRPSGSRPQGNTCPMSIPAIVPTPDYSRKPMADATDLRVINSVLPQATSWGKG